MKSKLGCLIVTSMQGSPGVPEVTSQLDTSDFGIVVVTPENLQQPWLNFEAGALSRKFGSGKAAKVAPLLVGIGEIDSLRGPLSQFNGCEPDIDGIQRMARSINKELNKPLDHEKLSHRIELEWTSLDTKINRAAQVHEGSSTTQTQPDQSELTVELLAGMRSLQQAVATQEAAYRFPIELFKSSLDDLHAEIRNFRKQVQLDFTRSVRTRSLDEHLIQQEVSSALAERGVELSSFRVGEATPDGAVHLYFAIGGPFNEDTYDWVSQRLARFGRFGLNIGWESEY